MVKLELRMRNNIVKILLIAAVAVILVGFVAARKSNALTTTSVDDFTLEYSPENPGANETVNITAISYIFDMNRSDVAWIVNGKKESSGVGNNNFSLHIGGVGTKTTLIVRVATNQGLQLEKTLIFNPAEVDILWEADNYVPLSYKGKSLPTSESRIKITAVPNIVSTGGKKISLANLIYKWKVNNENAADVSGYGKNSFTLRSSEIFNEDSVSVIVSDVNQSVSAEGRVRIRIESPKIIFYENRPIEGVFYNNALGGEANLGGDEISIRAEPFFFSKRNMKSLKYEWTMNGETILPDAEPGIITLRAEGGSGAANIGLRITNPISILQFAEKSFLMNYGQ